MFLNKLINKGYQAQDCQLCHTEFNLMKFQRIHKCKRCQKYICLKCGQNKQRVLDRQGRWTKQKHRICFLCQNDFLQIQDTIINSNMQWNRDTKMSKQWTVAMYFSFSQRQKQFGRKKDFQYEHFLRLFNQNLQDHNQQVQIIDKDVIKGRTDSSVFNFSMREFFYTVKSDVDNRISRENIRNVLYAVAARYDKVGYCQGMSGVAAFLLCFSSQKTAYTIFCDLLFLLSQLVRDQFIRIIGRDIFPSRLKKPLIEKIRGQFYEEEELSHFRTIIQLVGSKALLSLFVGVVSFSICIFIWEQIKENRKFQVVEKAFLAIIYLNRQKILQNRSFKVLQEIFERMQLQEFKQFYYDIEIDEKVRKNLLKQYHQNVSKKWSSKSDHQLKTLSKIVNFSVEQIMQLKEAFPEDENNKCITKQQFIELIQVYYDILKKQSQQQTILQTNSYFVGKIFQTYQQKPDHQYLDFREFVICLSICTKSKVKDRIKAIIKTFKDQNHLIDYDSFKKLIKNIGLISDDKAFQSKKKLFMERMQSYFHQAEKIHFKQLEILLNDDFINQLSFIVKSHTEEIVKKMIQIHKK